MHTPEEGSRLRPLRHRRFRNRHDSWCNKRLKRLQVRGFTVRAVVVVVLQISQSIVCLLAISDSTRTAYRQET